MAIMNVFITGASGYIGNRVAKAFARAGHETVGLVRSEQASVEIQRHEITPLIGTLEDLARRAQGADAIVHCAFVDSETDKNAVELLLDAKPKHFIYTSGVWVYGNQKEEITEKSPLKPLDLVTWRPPVEKKALDAGGIVIRPGHVYGYGKGLFAMIFNAALKGHLEIAGDGENHWSVVHADDLANLYVLAIEKGLKKVVLNGTEKKSIKLKNFVEQLALITQTKVKYLPYPEALKKFGPLAEGLCIDQHQITSAESQQLLGWQPRHNNLLSRLEHYLSVFKVF